MFPDRSLELKSLPELDQPSDFEAWKRELLADQSQLEVAIAQLEQRGHLGVVRAAMLLIGVAPERARFYATQALGSDDIRVHLLAESLLAALQTNAAWNGQANPKFDARSTPIVLERILAEAKSLRDYSPFGLELVMRVHLLLTDAYMIAGDLKQVREHAAEMSHLAFALDIAMIKLAANYHLATVAESEGHINEAVALLQSITQDPNASHLGKNANWSLARLLISIGDEDAAEALLYPTDHPPGTQWYFMILGLRFLTLRNERTDELEANLKFLPNYTAGFVAVFSFIQRALKCPPGNALERTEFWRQAHDRLNVLNASATDESSLVEVRILSAYLLMQMGMCGQAVHRLPTHAELALLPSGFRAFGYLTTVEVLERLLPERAEALANTVESTLQDLAQLEPRILKQIVRRLQLLTPRGLALLGVWPTGFTNQSARIDASNDFQSVARESIMNVRARPIEAYGIAALRPTQAAWFTLDAFEHLELSVQPYEGGGQRDALKRGLFITYHQNAYWFWPTAPARLAFALLCCVKVTADSKLLIRAVRELRRNYGLISAQMREADTSGNLNILDSILAKLEAGAISPQQASAMLGSI
jgi:hypothetical protein